MVCELYLNKAVKKKKQKRGNKYKTHTKISSEQNWLPKVDYKNFLCILTTEIKSLTIK